MVPAAQFCNNGSKISSQLIGRGALVILEPYRYNLIIQNVFINSRGLALIVPVGVDLSKNCH